MRLSGYCIIHWNISLWAIIRTRLLTHLYWVSWFDNRFDQPLVTHTHKKIWFHLLIVAKMTCLWNQLNIAHSLFSLINIQFGASSIKRTGWWQCKSIKCVPLQKFTAASISQKNQYNQSSGIKIVAAHKFTTVEDWIILLTYS